MQIYPTAQGLTSTLPSATLVDLARITGASLPQVSSVLPGRALGGFLGACFLPVAVRCATCWGPVGLAQVAVGVLVAAVPLCRTNAQMVGVFSVIGIFRSFIDAGESPLSFISSDDVFPPVFLFSFS